MCSGYLVSFGRLITDGLHNTRRLTSQETPACFELSCQILFQRNDCKILLRLNLANLLLNGFCFCTGGEMRKTQLDRVLGHLDKILVTGEDAIVHILYKGEILPNPNASEITPSSTPPCSLYREFNLKTHVWTLNIFVYCL